MPILQELNCSLDFLLWVGIIFSIFRDDFLLCPMIDKLLVFCSLFFLFLSLKLKEFLLLDFDFILKSKIIYHELFNLEQKLLIALVLKKFLLSLSILMILDTWIKYCGYISIEHSIKACFLSYYLYNSLFRVIFLKLLFYRFISLEQVIC